MDFAKIGAETACSLGDEPSAERRRRQEAEKWAHWMAHTVITACGTAEEQPTTPEAWRPSDGELTPGQAPPVVAGATGSEPADSESRVRLSVNAGDLGDVDIVVDRSPAGVRVIIGLADPKADPAVVPELCLLQRALEASGIRVASVRAVPLDRIGTVLAQNKSRGAEGEEPSEGRHEPRRRSKRLNLVG